MKETVAEIGMTIISQFTRLTNKQTNERTRRLGTFQFDSIQAIVRRRRFVIVLREFDCIVIGSVSEEQWTQM